MSNNVHLSVSLKVTRFKTQIKNLEKVDFFYLKWNLYDCVRSQTFHDRTQRDFFSSVKRWKKKKKNLTTRTWTLGKKATTHPESY